MMIMDIKRKIETGRDKLNTTFISTLTIILITFMAAIAMAAAPDAPTDHAQYKADGATAIAQGGNTDEATVKIKATVSDPDLDNVQLQVEIIDNAGTFTGIPNCVSGFVTSGSVATASCSGLLVGTSYKWQARTNDGTSTSAWQSYGVSDPDVTVTKNYLIHNSDNIGNASYGAWGVSGGKYGEFVCETCHTKSTTNIKRIRTSITAPNGTDTWPNGSITTNTIVFTQADGTNSDMGDTSAPFNGICNVCHDNTNHVHYSYNNSDGTHNVGADCTACHQHRKAFKGLDCNGCHGGSGTTGAPLISNDLVGVQDTFYPTTGHTEGAHNTHVETNGYSDCNICHLNHGMPTVDELITIAFSGNATANGSTPTYDGIALNSPYAYTGDVTGTTTATQDCSNVYCHSNVQGQTNGTGSPTLYGTPDWANATSVQCGSCHKADGTQGDASLMDSGTHTTHVNTSTYNKACSTCHSGAGSGTSIHVNNTINVSIDATYGGSYDGSTTTPGDHSPGQGYGTCSNVYCHSDAQPTPTYANPAWGSSLPTDCTGCHNNNKAATPNTMSSGGHTAHINKGTMMTDKTCDTCHTSTVSGDRTIVSYTLHVNKTKDVTINATYDGDGTPNNNYSANQCSNLYCHSNATALTGPYSAPNTVPTWGTTTNLGCSDCHDGPPSGPSYTNGSPKANSHANHTGSPWNFECVECHSSTVDASNAITTPANHLNKTYNVSGADIGGYTYDAAGGTCSTIACHGNNSAQWGSTLSCSDCHLGTGDVDDYVFNNGTTARLDSTEWTSSGHGKTTGTYSVSGNAAANLSCEYCHDETVSHGTTTNPFRLANYNVSGNGWNDNCFICHKTGSTGYDPDGTGPLALKNSTLKIDKYHYGTKHGATNDGGSLCFDCHDPHGDSNIYMVHVNVTKDKADTYGTPASSGSPVFTNNATGTDYAKSVAPFNGVCNVCHTTTNHYTSTSGDGHNSGTKCTTCHNHSGDTTIDGNAFSPTGGACNSCHGYPPQQGDGFTCQDDPVCEGKGAHVQHVNNITSAKGVTLDPNNDSFGTGTAAIVCGTCHTNNSSNHMSGTRVINFGDGTSVSEYEFVNGSGLTYNGVPGTSSTTNLKSCSNISCHFVDSPGWQDPATSGP